MRVKTKQTQNKVFSPRDEFRTPRYAVELLIPFIPKVIDTIWEPAAGEGYITKVLEDYNYKVISSDVRDVDMINGYRPTKIDFFYTWEILYHELLSGWWDDENTCYKENLMIVTNPPFSLKQEFFNKCTEFGNPFALLIPGDYCGWVIDAVRLHGCEKIIPTRRIDYITPNYRDGTTSDFHSIWLTKGFNLGQSETFVDLTLDAKKYRRI